MSATHLHLLLNHVPVLGTVLGLGLLAFGLWRRSDELIKAVLGVFVIVALTAVPVYLTGEPAEHGVKSLPGVSKPLMEQHEQAAAAAFTGVLTLGVIALAGLIWLRRGRLAPGWFGSAMLGVALIVCGLMAWTANLGGQIRHTEIRPGASAPAAAGNMEHD